MNLREYQEEAADFIYEHDRSMILAWVGAGKTACALTAMQAMIDDQIVHRWLVIAPKRVCWNVWPQEAKKWSRLSVNVAVGAPSTRKAAFMNNSDVVVINYDNLQWVAEKFPDLAQRFDGIVFDELTRLKNPSGKRFKAFLEVVDGINIRVGLTGSFTSNGLEDVFGQCKIIDQSLLGRSKGAFMQTYFWCANPQFGDWIPRPGALGKVMERIRPATFLLENAEYRDTLPPLHIIEQRVVMDEREPYEKMKKDFVVELDGQQITALSAGVVTQKLLQGASGFFYNTTVTASDTPGVFDTTQTPVWFSGHKFDALEELLDENQHENTIVFYNFKEELAELQRRFPHAQTLDAKDAVQRWNDGRIPLLVAHPASAGHGLNLQLGGSAMVFTSLPWSLELFEQAIGRLHRSGQKHAVRVYCLLTENTVDEKVFAALQDKKTLAEIAVEALK